MRHFDQELPAEARQYIIFINLLAPLAVLAILWALYISVALFDFDLVQLMRRRGRGQAPRGIDAEQAYLWIAVIGTVLCSGFAWFSIRRALHLANHGIPVVCNVLKVGKISMQGMVRVDYEYVVDGATYKQCLSCLREIAREYESGSKPLEIVYDPQRPKRVMLKSDVFETSASASDGMQDS